MIAIGSSELYQLLGQCAVLRGSRRFSEAIALVEPHLDDMEPDAQEVALLQLLYAANEGGMRPKTIAFAKRLATLDPEIPAVKKVLAVSEERK